MALPGATFLTIVCGRSVFVCVCVRVRAGGAFEHTVANLVAQPRRRWAVVQRGRPDLLRSSKLWQQLRHSVFAVDKCVFDMRARGERRRVLRAGVRCGRVACERAHSRARLVDTLHTLVRSSTTNKLAIALVDPCTGGTLYDELNLLDDTGFEGLHGLVCGCGFL